MGGWEHNHARSVLSYTSRVEGLLRDRAPRGASRRPTSEIPGRTHGQLANEITRIADVDEIIYFWRPRGPAGVSLKTHDDHIHFGYRSVPTRQQ